MTVISSETGKVLLSIFIVYWTWSIVSLYIFFKPRNEHSFRSVAILVLGDIGRSPRMMYHAESFAESDFQTDIIGYGGSKPIPALKRLPRVQLHYLPQLPPLVTKLPFVFLAPIKIVHQVLSILLVLFVKIPQPPQFILVQNPPSIPTLAIVALVSRIRGCKVIIDWHNLGYSILALRLGQNHVLVRIARWIEKTFGRNAYAHLFVTQAMHDFLITEWDLRGHKVVLHDRPPRHFHRSTSQEVHNLFVKLMPVWRQPPILNGWIPESSIPYSTPITRTDQSSFIPFLRQDRPALVVSSTSWTPDEDFGILKVALGLYDERARMSGGKLPKLLMVVTGKGPMKAAYMRDVEEMQKSWDWVRCVAVWLDPQDYPILLGSCDLGVSLHSSSSALDLPMKVVDMFGCDLPVCALKFKCLDELVKHDVNGFVFDNGEQLAEQFEALLMGFPNCPRLSSLRMPRGQWSTWDENWAKVMRPLIFLRLQRPY